MVLQDHALRAGDDRLPGRAAGLLDRQGRQRPAQLDRPVRGCSRRLRGGGPRPGDRVHHPAGHAVRGDVLRHRGGRQAGRRDLHARAAGGVRRLPGGGPQGLRHRPAVDRAAEDRRVPGSVRRQPGHRRADPGVGRRLRAGRLRHRRDHGRSGRRPARLRLREGLRPADRPDRPAAGRLRRRGLRRVRSGHQLRQRRDLAERHGRGGGEVDDHRLAGEQGPGQRHGQLPAARLAAVPSALLGCPDPDHPLPGLR